MDRLVKLPWGDWVNPEQVVAVAPAATGSTHPWSVKVSLLEDEWLQSGEFLTLSECLAEAARAAACINRSASESK